AFDAVFPAGLEERAISEIAGASPFAHALKVINDRIRTDQNTIAASANLHAKVCFFVRIPVTLIHAIHGLVELPRYQKASASNGLIFARNPCRRDVWREPSINVPGVLIFVEHYADVLDSAIWIQELRAHDSDLGLVCRKAHHLLKPSRGW